MCPCAAVSYLVTSSDRQRTRTSDGPVMINVSSHAINNCTRTWTYQCTTPMHIKKKRKKENHQSQSLHNKNMSYRHSLSMSTSSSSSCSFCSSPCSYSPLSCLSPWCAGSAVSLTLVLAEAVLDFKNISVSLQHFSLSANSALLDFSFFFRSSAFILDTSIHFFFFS